jgi:mRNA interferase MazF
MARKSALSHPKRGEVYLVNFDPTVGSEIRKKRPALVLQNEVANRYSPITIVAAIFSQFEEPPYPTEVFVDPPEGGLNVESVVLLNQIRSIDKQRLIKRLGALRPETMEKIDQAIEISLGLTKI